MRITYLEIDGIPIQSEARIEGTGTLPGVRVMVERATDRAIILRGERRMRIVYTIVGEIMRTEVEIRGRLSDQVIATPTMVEAEIRFLIRV